MEVVVAYFKALYKFSAWEIEEAAKNLSQKEFEPSTSWIQVRSFAAWPSLLGKEA
jgi:hypothetical protein